MLPALITYVLLVLALVACLVQFVLLKREIWREASKAKREQARLQESVDLLRTRLEELETEVQTQSCFTHTPDTGGMNFSRRARILRMHRRGDRPDQIAAALNLPQNEIALLLKMQQLS